MKKLLLIVMVAAHFVAFGQNKKKSIPYQTKSAKISLPKDF